MTSYIFNFRNIAVVAAILSLAVILEIAVTGIYDSPGTDYKIREEINAMRPDIILVGDSMLLPNVNQKLFNVRLSELCRRPIESLFIALGDSSAEWWYLVLKNQVGKSNISGIPVGILYRVDSLTRVKSRIAGEYLLYIQRQLTNSEPVFYEKTGDRLFKLKKIFKTYYYRWRFSTNILRRWVNMWISFIPAHPDPKSLLESRFGVGKFREDVVRDKEKQGVYENFDKIVNTSFLPDMIKAMRGFAFFAVEVSRNPWNVEREIEGGKKDYNAYLQKYKVEMKNYLNKNNIKQIFMGDKPALYDSSLYIEHSDHLHPDGIIINSIVLAEEIYRNIFSGVSLKRKN